jgi:hypothetical protein
VQLLASAHQAAPDVVRVTVDATDRWGYAIQAVSAVAAFAAAGVAAYGIVQGRRLQADRERAVYREHQQGRIDALDHASEVVYRIGDHARNMNPPSTARDQQRLRIAAHRASGSTTRGPAKTTRAFLAVADFDFQATSVDERDELLTLCDAAIEEANQEVARLAHQIGDTFPHVL